MSTRRRHLVGLLGLGGLGLAGAGLAVGPAAPVALSQPLPPSPDPTLPPRPSPSRSPDPTRSPGPPPDPPPDPPRGALALTARRTELTLPELPSLGVPYVCLLDLFDPQEAQVGTATAGATVVGVTLAGPVVLASVVLHLVDGEIHYQRVMDRFGAYPRTVVGAVLGGTGAYRDARGEVGIAWPDPDRVDLRVQLAAPPG